MTTSISSCCPNSLSCTVSMQELRKLDAKGLHDLREVLRIMIEILSAFCCQPRFRIENSCIYNSAGEQIEDIARFFEEYEEAIVNAARAAKPVTPAGVEWKSWTILGFEADMADDLPNFAVHAAEAVREEAEAKFNEQGCSNDTHRSSTLRHAEGCDADMVSRL